MLPEQMESMTGMSAGASRRRTHRGRRGRGKGPAAHHAEAKTHMASAMASQSPSDAHRHLFKALSALNRAKKSAVQDTDHDGM